MKFSDLYDGGRVAAGGLRDFAAGLVSPALRLGVTGLSRSGKTVFITALVHAMLRGGRLPAFEAMTQGRVTRVFLEPQPDDDLPRFAYEDHLAAVSGENRHWPEGTRRISQLRLTIEYIPRGFIARNLVQGRLHLDIIDYPGEWLLDLPLMKMSYAEWSAATVAASRTEPRLSRAAEWHRHLRTLDAMAAADEAEAIAAAGHFTAYLASCRDDEVSLSALPPGRFLMPGDFAGSPLLAFAPLDVAPAAVFPRGSLGALMERRYQSYVDKVVKPFFFGHFARLDRQIVLVDALTALNAGAGAVKDLQAALTQILTCFRQGSNSLLSSVFGHRVDRILFAATKADLLHHGAHDRLEDILKLIVAQAMDRAAYSGAALDVTALAAIRSTREAAVKQKGETLDCVAGIPQQGESIGTTTFDGETEAAIFTGDLPADPAEALDGSLEGHLRFLRFRPPLAKDGRYPHIRLDRALEFLIGDRLA
ncbi:MAG: YcjX family protein [Alphaproteobacteria bacterium]|nr:YcjX family protein [Alphaproteobacteria bacterium]